MNEANPWSAVIKHDDRDDLARWSMHGRVVQPIEPSPWHAEGSCLIDESSMQLLF